VFIAFEVKGGCLLWGLLLLATFLLFVNPAVLGATLITLGHLVQAIGTGIAHFLATVTHEHPG
jgi:hypothetical protein